MKAVIGTSVSTAINWLKAGEPVALPTETVYGLAAPLTSIESIRKIYELKERPADNPLIVHVLDGLQLESVAEVTPCVLRLVERFWPGPLTLVLKRKLCVPDIVTSGQETVAVRAPQSLLFREVIRLLGSPLVAPSANKFQHVSPTTAQHVLNDMGDVLKYILDGGPCTFGLESTILSLVDEGCPKLLRYGPIAKEVLEDFLGQAIESIGHAENGKPHLSPGLYKKHYSPKTPLYWLSDLATYCPPEHLVYTFENKAAHVFLCSPKRSLKKNEFVLSLHGNLSEVAANLFAMLQRLDEQDFASIWIEKAPTEGIGNAINDRLSRAAHYNFC